MFVGKGHQALQHGIDLGFARGKRGKRRAVVGRAAAFRGHRRCSLFILVSMRA
jgi:hypothetical protein